jgi:Cd2+/Zn2+-exporting ATPase
MMSSEPLSLKFKVTGMDCAACARKIETAVGRIPGASAVTVGVTSETLSLLLAEPGREGEVARAVEGLGYGFNRDNAVSDWHEGPHGDRDGHPIEGQWWRSAKGRLVLISGGLIALAYLAMLIAPRLSLTVFLAAGIAGAYPVVRRAFAAARAGVFFTIEMLMTVAVAGAVMIGATREAALVVFLFAVGELLEGIAAGRARSGIKALAGIAPKTAMLETADGLVETPIERIAPGAIVVVRPGDRVPADATVISGISALDESALTGESIPKVKEPGDRVLAGSINSEAVLRCRVEAEAKDTLIARVVKLVEQASDAKAPTERFIDTFSRYYMPAVCALALGVALVPPLASGADWFSWIYRALALLLIGCPCALVISTPAAIASALAAGARRGLLVKGGGVLEAIGKVETIAFDKTGTLTQGRPKVTDIVPLAQDDEADVLRIAAAAEAASSHPLAEAIVAAAKERSIVFTPARHSQVLPGKGVAARVDGPDRHHWRAGAARRDRCRRPRRSDET